MKKILLLLTVVLFSAGAYAQSVEIRTLGDSLSYAIGIDAGIRLKEAPVALDPTYTAAGVKDAMEKRAAMTEIEAYGFLEEYFTRRLPEIKMGEAEAYLMEIERSVPDVKRTESGLRYQIVEPGGKKPDENTRTVLVHYVGKLSNGEPLDSSYDREEPLRMEMGRMIAGFEEGLLLVGEGGTIRLWIPPNLGYGERASGPVPAYEPLFFEITMLEIDPE